MNNSDLELATTFYHGYLRRFGITQPGDRVAELSDLDFEHVHFFAYSGEQGLRLKAAVTPKGMITPDRQADDDWGTFLLKAPDAETAANRMAWLESDATVRHGQPPQPVLVLTPTSITGRIIDPALLKLVNAPTLVAEQDGGMTFAAWFLPGGSRIPVRWTITTHATGATTMTQTLATELLDDQPDGVTNTHEVIVSRARQLLLSGTQSERLWALQQITDRSDIATVAKLLTNQANDNHVRLFAAAALGRIGDLMGISALDTSLRADPAVEVRRACAQALAVIIDNSVVSILKGAAAKENDASVRAEIIRALGNQGPAARPTLDQIAITDHEASLRDLAHGLSQQ